VAIFAAVPPGPDWLSTSTFSRAAPSGAGWLADALAGGGLPAGGVLAGAVLAGAVLAGAVLDGLGLVVAGLVVVAGAELPTVTFLRLCPPANE
jgi:hypothetical protein